VAGWEQEFEALYANFATTLIGIAIAVFTIDRANERRAEQQLRAQLIREMGSTDNGIALRAMGELWVRGWISDGSLRRVHLARANLQTAFLIEADLQDAYLERARLQDAVLQDANLNGANLKGAKLKRTFLRGADLRGADLRGADLRGADLREAKLQVENPERDNLRCRIHLGIHIIGGLTDYQFATLERLWRATMPNNSRYDGRFNLSGDIGWAKDQNINPDDPEDMAHFYGVPLEAYLAGQEWARENLARVRREAGLEQEETAETAEAPQPEEPQSAAPSSSALPPLVVPAQSLLSFTVRRLIGLFWPFGL
jgi:hypothetical protein